MQFEPHGTNMGAIAIRGSFFDFIDDPWSHPGDEQMAARFYVDGLLVVEDGIIKDFGAFSELSARHGGVDVTHIKGRLILPGFIDGHVHMAQTRMIGYFGGGQLLPWLEKGVFPEELKYGNRSYAQEGARHFFDNLLAGGTTTCQNFTNSFSVSTEAAFDEAARRNMRIISGLTGIDAHAPEEFIISPENFYRASKALIARYHRKGRSLYAIAPRYAMGASHEMLSACRRLKAEHPDCWVNTHISENPSETRGVLQQHPDCSDYLGVYEKYRLVGPKFSAGHGVWLSDNEFRRLAASGAAVVSCPTSNLFLGSGLFRIGRATDPEHRVRLAFGSDIGAGPRFSMLGVLSEAYKVGMCQNTLLDGSVDPRERDLAEAERCVMSPYRAFWSITLGAARALYLDDLVGNFQPGKEADFVALDWNAGPPELAWRQSLAVDEDGPHTMREAAHLLFGMMIVGDDRNVAETWVMGRRAWKKAFRDSNDAQRSR